MKFCTSVLAVAFVLCTGTTPTFAQTSSSSGFDFKAASLADVKDAETKFVGLAKAIPADKYTWRPGEGVRSVSEVLLHVITADYSLMNMIGTPLPDGFNRQGFEKSTTDKDKIIDELNKSFAYVESAIEKTPDSQLQKQMKLFGGKEGTAGTFSSFSSPICTSTSAR